MTIRPRIGSSAMERRKGRKRVQSRLPQAAAFSTGASKHAALCLAVISRRPGSVAAQTGPEAAHTNPSALAGQKGLAVTASGEMLYNITTWSDPALGRSTLQPKANFPPLKEESTVPSEL